MSKITPKNLSYDTTLPPFLARLQSQNASNDGRQDYHAARPKKPRDAELDAEDEPVYFDEQSGETLTKGEWEEREKFEGGEETVSTEGEAKDVPEGGKEMDKEKEKVAAIGGSKKRKAGKVVGADEQGEADGQNATGTKKSSTENRKPATGSKPAGGKPADKGGKAMKKGKKIKLSFGDDE